jgi:hypothetical protein
LTFYYHKFIKNFAKITTPLPNLLKKSSGTYEWDEVCNETFETYEWDEVCNEAFETLQDILVKALMLKLPDFDIHFDVSNFVIGGVLV